MTNRTFPILGLAVTLIAAGTSAAWAQSTTMKWSAGSVPSPRSAAEEAAQLAHQAQELAARAAQLAAAAQADSGASGGSLAATTGLSGLNATSAPQRAADRPVATDIQFRNGAAVTMTDASLPSIELPEPALSSPSLSAGVTPLLAPARPADGPVQLATRTFTDGELLRIAQQPEPMPATTMSPGAPPREPVAPNAYDQSMVIDDACCAPQRMLFWTAGVEATFLNPDLNNDGAYFSVEEVDNNRYDAFSSISHDTDSLYFSPRAWIGVQGCLWGANLRYWHLQASEGAYDPTIGSLNSWDGYDCGVADVGYFTCSRLEAYTVDLELTRRFCFHDCWMQAAVGLRHAELEHSESITGLALTDEGLLSGYARDSRYTRGTGFLLGLYGRRPVFPCSSVHWFYNVRWSALWGPTHTSAETYAAVAANDPNFTASAASVNGAYTCVDDTLFIGEIQLGLEWNYALVCMPANAFFRVALEYQRWDGGPGLSGANSFAGITLDGDTEATSIVNTSAVADAPQLDLVGFTIGTGLTW